jgi:streptogramin lyase
MRPARRLLLAALALAVLAGAPAAAAGEPVGIAESFPTDCNVGTVAATADGGAWFACTKYTYGKGLFAKTRAQAGRITATGQVSEFASAAPLESGPTKIPGVVAADGSFWFPVAKSFYAEINYSKAVVPPTLARVTPDGTMTLFPVSGGSVTELAALPDGSLRMKTAEGFEGKGAAVWQVSATGEMVRTTDDPALPLGETAAFPQHPFPPGGTIYTGQAIGADGNLWFGIQSGRGAIGRLTPTGETTTFSDCLRYSQPYFGPETLVRGAEGNIWFTSLAERSLPSIVDPASIGMVTPAGGITQIYAGVTVEPKTIAASSEGGAWFAGGLEEIQRIRPPQGPVNTFHIGRLGKLRGNGSALLTVKVPSAGKLRTKPVAMITGKKKSKKRIAIKAPAGDAATPVCGSPQVKIQLAGEALSHLRATGKVRVAVAITFTPRGGHSYTEERSFFFQLPHHQ